MIGELLVVILIPLCAIVLLCVAFFMWRRSQREDSDVDLLYALTHDISNPLQGILATLANMSSYSLYSVNSEDNWRQDIYSIHMAITHLADVTANFKALALLDAPDFRSQRRLVDMAGIAQKAIISMDSDAEASGVRLTYQGSDTSPRIWGNESDLERVMYNLISNGIKYRDLNQEQNEVVVTVDSDGKAFTIMIEDNGIGIARERLAKIWDAPFQPRTARTIGIEGTGLGLYLVKRIVNKYGGRIDVTSTVNHGTRFSLRFPIADV